ncbi:hypothetical protein KJS94_15040 [Flavihumibacter rivuli]|uniref:hypothetical protein n=1 Tax=Flavihumibacter rivuli TaxID=2838156 RepID=UPI001BDDDC66|nr:hypothetical protein [Flavihumibacter rivuli]ULQ55964.1 hypothetical protein KJS94_15040 [Flavihumibacter rivuli]
MVLSKPKAYLLLISAFIALALFYQTVWLFSSTVNGKIVQYSRGVGKSKSLSFVEANYEVNNELFNSVYLRNGYLNNDGNIPIRYLIFCPGVSRMDTVSGNWGLVFSTGLSYFLITTICFLHRDIIPKDKKVKIQVKPPFISVYP